MSATQNVTPTAAFNWTGFDSPSTAVITAVAEESDEDPRTLDPLYEVIDPESLNSFLALQSSSERTPNGSVEFEYQDYWVVINATGRGYIYD